MILLLSPSLGLLHCRLALSILLLLLLLLPPPLPSTTDGVAATRDPEDLVGSGTVYKFGTDNERQWSRADVRLQGRGAFGKWVTTKK